MKIIKNYNLKELNTLKIEAITKLYIEIDNLNELIITIKLLSYFKVKYLLIGNGSKLLFANDVIECVILKLSNEFTFIIENRNNLIISSNLLLKNLILKFAEKDINFNASLYPIPCSIGGAIYMNCGANKTTISDNIKYVIALNNKGKIKIFKKKECKFKYRYSIFQKNKLLIIGAVFEIFKEKKEIIYKIIKNELLKRIKTQEVNNTCGSIFKNTKKEKAYKLIDKYYSFSYSNSNIHLSNKHHNFLINENNGKGKDAYKLIRQIQEEIYLACKIKLKFEVIIIK